MEILLLAFFAAVITIDYRLNNHKIVSAFLLIMTPYVAIVLFNNFVAVGWGFHKITGGTIGLLILGMSLFYVGSLSARYLVFMKGRAKSLSDKGYSAMTEIPEFNTKLICFYVFCVCCLRILQLGMRFVSKGLAGMMADDFAAFQIDGIIGHFVLSIKPLCAILFYEWLKNKRKGIYLLVVLLAAALIASSFIKYHIMTFVLVIFLYTCFRDHRYFFKMGIVVLIVMVAAFVFNYLISFIMRSMDVSNSFYLMHLWKYLAGGTINMNTCVGDPNLALTIKEWCYDFFMPLPNMFLSAFTKPAEGKFIMEMLPVAGMDEASNVITTIGYIFAQRSFPFACFITFMWGMVSGGVFSVSRIRRTPVWTSFATVFFAYNTVSFFSSFFRLSGPWEELVLSVLAVYVFTNMPQRGKFRRAQIKGLYSSPEKCVIAEKKTEN